MDPMVLFWLCAMVVLGLAEAATVGLVCIWFAGGALVSLLATVFGASVELQIGLFLVVSGVLLLCLRPVARRMASTKTTPTNVDGNIGKTAVVFEPIDNLKGTGRVMIGSVDWTARSADGSRIEKDELVRVLRIEGVKVCVERVRVGAQK